MLSPAHVTNVAELEHFHAALIQFKADVLDALTSLNLDVRRGFDWLEDQRKYWERAVRECRDEVTIAKSELNRRKMVSSGERIPDTTQQEEALELAQRRFRHAEDRVERTRRWETTLRREVDEYEGPIRRLGNLAESELPKSAALLRRMVASIDAYLAQQTAPKPAGGAT